MQVIGNHPRQRRATMTENITHRPARTHGGIVEIIKVKIFEYRPDGTRLDQEQLGSRAHQPQHTGQHHHTRDTRRHRGGSAIELIVSGRKDLLQNCVQVVAQG